MFLTTHKSNTALQMHKDAYFCICLRANMKRMLVDSCSCRAHIQGAQHTASTVGKQGKQPPRAIIKAGKSARKQRGAMHERKRYHTRNVKYARYVEKYWTLLWSPIRSRWDFGTNFDHLSARAEIHVYSMFSEMRKTINYG